MNVMQDPDSQAPVAVADCPSILDTLADELNLAFMFQVTATQFLIKIASGQINLVEAAKAELAHRRLESRTRSAQELSVSEP